MSDRLKAQISACVCCSAIALSAHGAEFTLVPKSITGGGGGTIVGQDVTLQGTGQQVTIHVELSGWDPNLDGNPLLGAFQAAVDPVGYDNGGAVSLVPLGWPATPSDGAFQSLNLCTVGGVPDPNGAPCEVQADCTPQFCIPNQRWVYTGIPSVNAVATATLEYEFAGSAQSGGRAADGSPWYGGTVILEVPPGASGLYTIGFASDANATFMRDANALAIEPVNLIPMQITVLCQSQADCDDSNLCTDDTCLGDGTCTNVNNYDDQTECCNPATGTVTPLDDGNSCSLGVCDPLTGEVTQICLAAGTLCGNPAADACDLQDTCDGNCLCVDRKAPAGTACGSPANTECTDPDTCDGAGACDPNHATLGAPCGDSSNTTCTDPDSCNGNGACLNNHAPNGTPCDDGAFCTTGEDCTVGNCTGGSDTCNDSVNCTDDTCDEVNDVCSNVPNDANCNNGQFCDGVEICDAVLNCVVQGGSVPDCNDSVGCTIDICNELNDVCDNTPSNALCDNGQFCDGPETCDPDFDCQLGVDVDCNDQIDCTNDSCDEVNNVCVNAPDDGLCPDDALFCNGSEICTAGLGCDHTGSPCGGPCDEDLDICLCDAPLVTAAGSRYLAVSLQPAESDIPQAIVVRGACAGAVPRYVGAPLPFYNEGMPGMGPMSMAGLLVDDPADAVFLTPAEWGDPVYVTGETLAPGSTFDVWADCGSPGNPGFSESNRALTQRFGDVDGNTHRNFIDVQFCIFAWKGFFLMQPAVTRSRTDLEGCALNLLPNFADVAWAIHGFQRDTFASVGCSNECPPCHPADCDDDNACTVDSCVIEDGTCLNVLTYDPVTECCDPETGDALVIDDGDPCTNDICQPSTGGVTHNPLVCDDSDPCTVDECIGGTCVFTPFTDIPCETNADCPPTSPGCKAGPFDCTCPGTPAALFAFVPVGSTGPSTIVDNQIFIPQGGVDVTLEIFVSGWAPKLLGQVHCSVSEASLTSGDAGFLFPVRDPDPTVGSFIDTDRPDFVFGDPFTSMDRGLVIYRETAPFRYLWGGFLFGSEMGQTDFGEPYYLGTLVLQVSPDAAGTFSIDFMDGIQNTSMAQPNGVTILLISHESAEIVISGS